MTAKLSDKLTNLRSLYGSFDGAHRQDHCDYVTKRSITIVANNKLVVDMDMVVTIAVCHDIGLSMGDRKLHHINSAKMVRDDSELNEIFNAEQIGIIADACEDHRASGNGARTVYGQIVSDAYRDISVEDIMKSYSKKYITELGDCENKRDRKISIIFYFCMIYSIFININDIL